MTEAEVWELILISQGNTSAVFGIYLSIVSGYLVIAYLAGAKLSGSQVLTINALFLTGGSIGILGTYAFLSRAAFLLQFTSEKYTSPASTLIPVLPPLWSVILSLVLIASLKFMWDVRHPKIK